MKNAIKARSVLKNKKNEGGVLFSVVALIAMFTLIFFEAVDDYKLKANTALQAQEYYIAKTMESMSCSKLEKWTEEEWTEMKGTFYFNHGQVGYKRKKQMISLTTELKTGLVYHTKFILKEEE